jgi:hypothetical protein
MKELPSMEHTFSVKIEGKHESGVALYEGSFTYRRPNLRAKSQIAKLESKLNEDIKFLPDDVRDLHFAIAWLYYTIIDSPDWWKKSDSGMELYDFNIILAIYAETMKFEKAWKDKVWGGQEEAQKEAEKEIKEKQKKKE